MASPKTEQDVEIGANGHLPPGLTWEKVLDVLVATDDHQIFVNALGMALAESGNECLYKPTIQARCSLSALPPLRCTRGGCSNSFPRLCRGGGVIGTATLTRWRSRRHTRRHYPHRRP